MIKQAHWWALKCPEKWDVFNANWRPRKLFSTVNAELKAKWIEALTREQLIEAYSLVLNTEEEELQRIAKDKTYPFALRLIILELSDKKNRARALADYRDYMFWKAIQKSEIETTIKDVQTFKNPYDDAK